MFQTTEGAKRQVEQVSINTQKRINKVGLLIEDGQWIRGIRMVDEDGCNLVNSIWLPKNDKNHKWVMQSIPPNKEIIGIYGNNDSKRSSLIKSLGFILWTPLGPDEMPPIKVIGRRVERSRNTMQKNRS